MTDSALAGRTAEKIVVMGVAGCGKSTLAVAVADALGCPEIEGDDHHLPESQRKMREGIPLQDADREPWLDRLGELLAAEAGDLVLACSALKRAYRDRLRARVPGLKFVYVEITPEESARRVGSRPGHLFPTSLVTSQFEALQSPVGEDRVLRVDATEPREAQVGDVLRWLGRAPAAGG